MDKKYSIFISSTYKDLKGYRKSIHDAIIKSGHFPVAMENFIASDKSQWETIQPLIDSCDYYILILGFNYGSIDDTDGLSYTEKEYNYAVKNKKIVLSFLLDETFEIERDENLKNIEKFRDKVLNNNQLSQICKDNNNISSDIINALNQQYEKNPQLGWIRTNQYNILKQDYKELSSEYENLVNPEDLSNLIGLDDTIVLTGHTDISYNRWSDESTLKDIFLLTAKHIFEYFPENILFNAISQNIEFNGDIPDYSITIDEKSKREVRNKLKKLGLIMLSDVTVKSKTSILWKITKKGKYFYTIDA